MQQTRLSLLVSQFTNQCRNFVANPWRRLSVIIIGWLLGFCLPTLLTSSLTQEGRWDTSLALIFLVFTELINKIVFSVNKSSVKPWWSDLLYSFKLGFIYSLFLHASILTS